MFIYHIVYQSTNEFDGSPCVNTFATINRLEAARWLRCDRMLDVQVSMYSFPTTTITSAYDEIAF
jgi:hypothetical protein